MDFDDQIVMLEEVAADQVEVEVDTGETYLLQDPLTDHNYILTEAGKPSIPRGIKIRELKALYHCKRCGYATLKKDIMDAHSRTHKPKEAPKARSKTPKRYIPCPSCNVKPQKYEKCTQCSFFTKKKTSLKIHMRIHLQDKPYKCTQCEHRAEDLKLLIKHYEDGHQDIEKYKCNRCGYSTRRKSELAMHHLSEGRELNCDQCTFTTRLCGEMTRHMRGHVFKLNKSNTQ